MWRRTYLLLLVVRLWFALSPSYLHPDENFQGPEVIAGKLVPPKSPLLCARREPCHARESGLQDSTPLVIPFFLGHAANVC